MKMKDKKKYVKTLREILKSYWRNIMLGLTYMTYNIYDMEYLLEMVVEFGDSNIDDINLGGSTYDSLI
jgi:uncharacterized membrane protein